jgi:uncharacterized RDD family membrane protein YckC
VLLLIIGSVVISSALNAKDAATGLIIIILLIFSLAMLSYNLIFETIWKGQTPGKRIMRLRAVNDDGTYMNFTAVLLRNIFRIIDMLPAGYITGVIAMALNEKGKRIGDYVAGTIVIREPETVIPVYGKYKKLDCFSGADLTGLMIPGTKSIFDKYFLSKDILSPEARLKIESEIVQLIESRTGIKKPKGVGNEDFIGALYLLI